MSDSGTAFSESPPSAPSPSEIPVRVPKSKRISGSCDTCRKRKVKCDSQKSSGLPCTNCRAHNSACTYAMPVQKPGIKNYSRQVNILANRVKELEALLKENNINNTSAPPFDDPVADITAPHERLTEDSETDLEYLNMINDMKKFSIAENGMNERFFGPSSNIYFMRQMLAMKDEIHGPRQPFVISESIKYWENEHPMLMFPDGDLMQDLIDLFFLWTPNYLCILHEPSFRREVATGLHHINARFGVVVLLVCAVASRVSTDSRVLVNTDTRYSAGWQWASQAIKMHGYIFDATTLHDIQYYCLMSEYMTGSGTPQASWALIGLAMRFSVELGLHRRRDNVPTFQGELRKRIFWTVFILDRSISLFHGRPCSIADDEYDVGYPVICDDNYWDTGDPETNFKQPQGKPCRMETFVAAIKLTQITSVALRTVFGIRKSKEASTNRNFIPNHVALLDSMLNSWFNGLPEHLRWDKDTGSHALFRYSAEMFMSYYNLQIFIHRPFVHTPSSPLALPSLAICSNAARSTMRLMEMRMAAGPIMSIAIDLAAFSAGGAVIVNMWHTFKNGRSISQRDIHDMKTCLSALKHEANKFHMCQYLVHGLEVFFDGLPLDENTFSTGSGAGADLSRSLWMPSGYAEASTKPHPHPEINLEYCGLDSVGVMPPGLDLSVFGGMPSLNMLGSVPQADMSVFDADIVDAWMGPGMQTMPQDQPQNLWNEQWNFSSTNFFI